jgi:hypothetical protein
MFHLDQEEEHPEPCVESTSSGKLIVNLIEVLPNGTWEID